MAKSAPKAWDIQGSAKPILESILTEAFVSPEVAKEVACGQAPYKIRKKKGVKAKAYRTARALMPEKLTVVFQNGGVRVGDTQGDSTRILQMCGDLLGWNPDQKQDENSYCDELCSNFARDALELSAQYAGSYAGAGVSALEQQLSKVKGDLKYYKDEEDECKRSSEALSAFSAELEQLNQDIEVKHTLRMEAQDNLDEAEEELEGMLDELEDQSDILAKAQEELGLSKQKVSDLTSVVGLEKKKEKEKNEAMKKLKEELDLAGKELAKAEAASVALNEIKGLVTQTMLKMVAHYEVAVVRPVQKLGLKVATDIAEYFDGVMDEATSEKEAVDSTLTLMDKYCESTAVPHFKTVQSTLDLMPLCPKGNGKEVGNQIDAVVKQRASEVRNALESVRSPLDLYKGQEGMSKEESDRLTSLGELEGLREIATVYADSSYFSKYLTHWKFDATPPNFLQLIASLKQAAQRLAEQEKAMQSALEEAIELSEKQLQARKDAVNLLKVALANNEVLKGKEAEAQSELDAQQKLIEGQESDLDKLRQAWEDAQRAYKAAQQLLTSTYKRGTNLK